MTTKDTGGPAWPTHFNYAKHGAGGIISATNGMTLRDWFAGQALHVLLSEGTKPAGKIAAAYAYEYADAMIAERSKS